MICKWEECVKNCKFSVLWYRARETEEKEKADSLQTKAKPYLFYKHFLYKDEKWE